MTVDGELLLDRIEQVAKTDFARMVETVCDRFGVIRQRLEAIHADYGGKPLALVCFEARPEDSHRGLAARWLEGHGLSLPGRPSCRVLELIACSRSACLWDLAMRSDVSIVFEVTGDGFVDRVMVPGLRPSPGVGLVRAASDYLLAATWLLLAPYSVRQARYRSL